VALAEKPQTPDVVRHVTSRKSAVPAYVDVARRLQRRIVEGRLSSDRRLPSEAELAELYGVSRSTVREALRQVSAWGLVVTTRGVRGGSRVAWLDHDDVGAMLNVGIHLLSRYDAVSVRELVEARGLLEAPAAGLAAKRRSNENLTAIEATVMKVRPGMSVREIFEANRGFHGAVLDASGNRVLNLITEPLFQILQTRLLRERADPAFWVRIVSEHRTILDAIRRRDADTAERAMARHLSRLRTTYERLDIARQGPTAGSD
jgi:DNA-binding FadR family transcriptional regulator